MLKDRLNQLIEIATDDGYSSDIFGARKEYQTIAGDIYEDYKSYESRMALFLEWYILDRIIPPGTKGCNRHSNTICFKHSR